MKKLQIKKLQLACSYCEDAVLVPRRFRDIGEFLKRHDIKKSVNIGYVKVSNRRKK